MAEEVATSQGSPASQERGIFSLYGYFDKKKENEEPEESPDQPAAKTENQTSQHHTTDPPHAASETEVKEDPTDPPGHGAAAVEEKEKEEEEEEEEEEEGHDLTSQNQKTDPPHAATESEVKEGSTPTDSQTQPAYDLYPTEPPGDAADAVEKEEGGADTYPETRPAAATTDIAEERYDDQIIPPANTQTQPADLYPIEPPTAATAAPPENTEGYANSDKGQDINGFDEKQADTHGSTSSYGSEEDEEDNSQKGEEEKKIKGESVKNNLQGQLPEEQPSPSTEFANEEKFYPQSHENEGKVEEKKEGVKKKKRTVKDKIKEKLAGVGHHSTDSGAGEESPGKESPGKAGLLDRIKEKIPGHHA